MTSVGRVLRLLDEGCAEVSVRRGAACGGDCPACAGCGGQALVVTARNAVGARPGDAVELESPTGHTLGLAALVYLLPVVLFVAGLLAGIWAGVAGLLLGLAAALWAGRRRGARGVPPVGIARVLERR